MTVEEIIRTLQAVVENQAKRNDRKR